MADVVLDPDLLNKLRVVDLREHLAKRGLGTSGLKADLVKRLREALLSESYQQGDGSETVENSGIEENLQTFSGEQSGSANEDEDAQTQDEVNYIDNSSNFTAQQSEQQVLEEKYKQHVLAEQQKIAAEEEKKRAEEEQKRTEEEQRRRAEEEQKQALEEQRRAEELRRIEEEQGRAEELQRIEKEQREYEELQRIERERREYEELQRIEREQREYEELQRIENERRAELERRRAEERQQIEMERRRAEELQQIEMERRAEEERKRAEELQRIERERRAEEKRKRLEEEQRIAEEEMRKMAEEEMNRKAEEEQRRKIEEERNRIAEEEQRKKEEEKMRRAEEQRLRIELEMRRKEEEEKLRKAEEEKLRKAEEQRLRIELEMRRKEEEERLRKAEEDHKKKMEEDRIKRIMEERNRLADEEQKRMVEEQENQLRWAQQQQRQFADEQHQHKINEQQRLLAEQEEHKMLLAEKQHRLLENEQKIAEEHKKVMAEQQQMLLEQQKQRADEESMISAQQKLIAEQEMLQEQEHELLKLQQQAVKEKEQEQRIQQQMASHSIPSGPPPVPGVLLSHAQISSGTTFSHSLSAPPPPIQPSQIHMPTVPPPPPPTILSSGPPGLSGPMNSSMNIMTHYPPLNVPGMTLGAPPPGFPQPPPPATTTNMMTSSNLHASMSMTLNAQSSLPPLPSQTSMGDIDMTAPVTTEDLDSMMDDSASEIKLPQALEKVLALKTERAQLLGVDPDSVVQPIPVAEERETSIPSKQSVVTLVNVDEDEGLEEESTSKSKESKGRRRKKKKKKPAKFHQKENAEQKKKSEPAKEANVDIDIEYVQDVLDISDPLYSHFVKIFEKFKLNEADKDKEAQLADAGKTAPKEENINPMALRKKPMDIDDDDDDDDEKDDEKKDDDKPKLSKRKLKKLSRMSVAELKQKVNRPELVEMHDVTAKDPLLLLHLKASRNTVPVPRHWCFKRKYLQGKRGIEKPAFELPDFIKKTGIMEMRQALQEKEDQKTMKAKMRERVRPKMGKIDIDYQKLHDAFFKWQTKPRMTIHGDLYYEGKEFETRLKEKKPGDLSEDLRTALGMPTGPNANKCPPPWLIAMQRYGPPPSYPNLKIPGLNAPIPDSCSFGYHAGGWGKPPVDETGRPLYGDVFGSQNADNQPQIHEEEIDHTLWGELESESSEEEEEEEDEDEEEEEEKIEDETGLVTPAEGLITPSGFSSIPAGMETPDMIELRKRKIEAEMEGGETPALYTILPEKKTERIGAAMMGSTHIYDLAGAIPAGKMKLPGSTSVPPQGIEVALDPSELELDSAAMAARYEQTMREQQSQLEKEDLSDMVAEHAARQKNKRKKQQMDSAKPPKKYKEFKF